MGHGCLELSESRIDFGTLTRAQLGSAEIIARNPCEGPVGVTRLSVLGRDGEPHPMGDLLDLAFWNTASLTPGEELVLPIKFQPRRPGNLDAVITMDTTNAALGPVTMEVVAEVASAWSVFEPANIEVGHLPRDCPAVREFTLSNHGNRDLIIDELGWIGATHAIDVALVDGPDGPPWTLPPFDASTDGPILTFEATVAGELAETTIVQPDISWNHPYGPTEAFYVSAEISDHQPVIDSFTTHPYPALDVVFIIDRSPSMAPVLDKLAERIDELAEDLTPAGWNWRITAIAADDGCVIGDHPFLDASHAPSELQRLFQTLVDPSGEAGTTANAHRGFELALAGLSEEALGAGGCNGGLTRPDGKLAVVHVSRHAEDSDIDPATYVEALEQVADRVTVHAIAGGWNTGCGAASVGDRFREAVVETGGIYSPICRINTDDYPRTVAYAERQSSLTFPLSQPWHPGTDIAVKAGGYAVPEANWSFNPAASSVTVTEAIRYRGKAVEIDYRTPTICGP